MSRNQIVFTIFRLIWIQTEFGMDPNQSENGKYYLISVRFNKISKRFLCVWLHGQQLQAQAIEIKVVGVVLH